jgi:arylsulfatase A-like enzyme
LDTLAAKGVRFDNAFAQMPFTLVSHLSMFTGVHPDVHGVEKKNLTLSENLITIAELLEPKGYRSIGLVTNNWMDGDFGFKRGFDHYQRVRYGLTYAEAVNERIFNLLDRQFRGAEPLFIFLHYLDPHSDFTKVTGNTLPYYSPDSYRAHLDIDPLSRDYCIEDRCATEYLLDLNEMGLSAPPATLAGIKALYDCGVRYMDDRLAELFAGLEERGILENALVIVTADHGEEFFEHGRFIHSQPYVESLHIPLLVLMPGGYQAGHISAEMVETVDLLPTILDYLDLPVPRHVQGKSLLPLIEAGDDAVSDRSALSRSKFHRNLYSLRTADFTLVYDLETSRAELYDRRSDPAETRDLSAEHPEVVAELEIRLRAIVESSRDLARDLAARNGAGDVLSSEQQEQLKSIGYLQ